MNLFIFNYIFSFSQNPYVANLALFFSYYLVIAVIFIIMIWAIFFASKKMYSFSILFLAGLIAFALSNTLKMIFTTDRPFVVLNAILPLAEVDGFSFPSSHAAIVTALATVGFSLDRRVGALLFVLAVLVGISRIVIGVHYPFDIIGGWILGLLIGIFLIRLFKKL